MPFSNGLIGLPNVGKSTLFNALTEAGAAVANYPFCTIEPNVGVVDIPDGRFRRVVEVVRPQRATAAVLSVTDIAGLVEGASRGEGLGNQFLSHIREVDAILHVVRCFRNADIAHVSAGAEPVRDIEMVDTELLLADLESVRKRREKAGRASKSGERSAMEESALLERLESALDRGEPARLFEGTGREVELLESYQLLTSKPVLYVANTDDEGLRAWAAAQGGGAVDADSVGASDRGAAGADLEGSFDPAGGSAGGTADVQGLALIREVEAYASARGANVVPVCAQLEAELAELAPDEAGAFLEDLGLSEGGLSRLLRAAFEQLGIITFYTVKGEEARAWIVPRGTLAPQAAGKIHSDMERGFIRAEVIGVEQLEEAGGFGVARERGWVRSEGREYAIRDGDVALFRFNV